MELASQAAQVSSIGNITVSVVSHGQSGYVRYLLQDLHAAATVPIEKVILTRNIPEPDLVSGLTLRFPLEVIDNTQVKGYGANQNTAFSRCRTPWFLVLNPDLRIGQDVIPRMLQQVLPDTGVVAPRIVEPGKSIPEPRRALLTPFEIMGRWFRPGHEAPRAEWVPGMFMLFRTDVFAALRGFDEKFFMYVEDADICARLRLAAWEVQVVETVRVLHDAQRASDRDWQALAWHWTSMLRWWFSTPFWRLLALRYLPMRNM